jgi:hypothetical protein
MYRSRSPTIEVPAILLTRMLHQPVRCSEAQVEDPELAPDVEAPPQLLRKEDQDLQEVSNLGR